MSDQKLSEKRIESRIKLLKAFEDIYSRYSKDFPDADEIDLLQEKVVVDNGFVRNTPVKEIGKLHKNFHVERYDPYSSVKRKLKYDDDAFDSLLGNRGHSITRKVKITRVLNGIIPTPVKRKFVHLGDFDLQSPLDPLTTPVKKLITSIHSKAVKRNFSSVKKFVQKESPLKYEITTPVRVFTHKMQEKLLDLEKETTQHIKEVKHVVVKDTVNEEDITEAVQINQVKTEMDIIASVQNKEEIDVIRSIVDIQDSDGQTSDVKQSELIQVTKEEDYVEQVTEAEDHREQVTKEEDYREPLTKDDYRDASRKVQSVEPVSETGSWWDIYEETYSPEFKSRTVIYDSEADV